MITSDSNHLIKAPFLSEQFLVEEVDQVEIWWLRTRKYRFARSIGRILSWVHFEWRLLTFDNRALDRPDAIIVSSLSLLTILNGFRLRRKYQCRLIFEIRDIWPLTLVEEGGFHRWNPLILLLGLVEQLGYRRADAVVGTMPNLVEHVREQVRDHAPVYSIPFGVPEEMAQSTSEPTPEWYDRNLPSEKFVVCHSGTIGGTNALDAFFDCAIALRHEDSIHFLLLGDGDYREVYEAEYGDLPNLTFAGAVPSSQVLAVLQRCDLLYFAALPSKVWQYGMSLNKVIDYMLAARPIVGSYTGYRTFVEDADAGSIIPSGDASALAEEILRYQGLDRETLNQIGSRGRQWLLENRSYRKLAQDYLKVLGLAHTGRRAEPVRDERKKVDRKC